MARRPIRAMLATMGILSWIIFGLVAGIIAKLIMPGKDPGGWIITILLGIGGSYVGGYLAGFLGIVPPGAGFNIKSFATAVGGALVLLFLYRLIKRA
jgi:uncharacterized membrane protein YeaQ/YmgE (transglycosylase-associated protein family)